MHIEKVQDLSTNLNHLSCTINSLRRQLQENNIKEGNTLNRNRAGYSSKYVRENRDEGRWYDFGQSYL